LLYLFEDLVQNTDRRELRRDADVIPTTPQLFDLLDYLIQHRERSDLLLFSRAAAAPVAMRVLQRA